MIKLKIEDISQDVSSINKFEKVRKLVWFADSYGDGANSHNFRLVIRKEFGCRGGRRSDQEPGLLVLALHSLHNNFQGYVSGAPLVERQLCDEVCLRCCCATIDESRRRL